jgi:hypothetical protein
MTIITNALTTDFSLVLLTVSFVGVWYCRPRQGQPRA